MFKFLKRLFKKKNTENENAVEVEQPAQPQSDEKSAPNHPSLKFGTAQEFLDMYMKDGEHLNLGQVDGKDIGVSLIDPPGDDIVIINDNPESVMNQCVAPVVLQSKLSYIVYDPDGKYQEALGTKMRLRGYDIQVVDLNDEQHNSRIDLFEITNITKNPYWLSVILSGSIKCVKEEVAVAHNLFMSAMQYILATNGKVTIENFSDVCKRIVAIDTDLLRAVRLCPESKDYIENLAKFDPDLLNVVYQKAVQYFFTKAAVLTSNPNIFTVTAHQKQTVTFVRRVPKSCRHLITAMLFNLKTSNIVCGYGDVSTLIIDTSDEKWYNKAMLEKVTSEAGEAMDRSVGMMTIRPTIENALKTDKNQILIYMHSDDGKTKEHVHGYLRVGGHQKHKAGLQGVDGITDVFNMALVKFEELDTMQDSVIIDTSGLIRPFRCDRLVLNG